MLQRHLFQPLDDAVLVDLVEGPADGDVVAVDQKSLDRMRMHLLEPVQNRLLVRHQRFLAAPRDAEILLHGRIVMVEVGDRLDMAAFDHRL